MLAQKEAFFDRYPAQVQGRDGAMADVMLKTDQAETRDRGINTFATYEPGYPTTYKYTFALTGNKGEADPVAAHRFGSREEESYFVELPPDQRPTHWTASLLSLRAPNIILETLKPSADGVPGDFLLRLQEIAGKPTELDLRFPLPLHSIAETNLNEDRVLQQGIQAKAIHLSPYQSLTLRLSVAASGEKN
jgi:hypothetical protein